MLAGAALMMAVVAAPPSQPKGDINFEGLAEGTIVNQVSPGAGMSGTITGTVGVWGFSPAFPAQNTAMVFDSSCPPTFTPADCSGEDDDLGTPNEAFTFKPAGVSIPGPGVGEDGHPSNSQSQGKTLIVTEDLDSSDPDDADLKDMYVDFDFAGVSGDVKVDSVKMMDVETEQGEDGTYLEFWTDGSADPTDMIAIPPSGDNGDNFHSHNVEVVGCEIIDALTGPEQPGGKKGFEENLLHFRGVGRVRDGETGEVTDGVPFRGCVIDAGEPAGKQGLNTDYFELVVCASGSCDLGSGRCSVDTTQDDLNPTGPQDTCNGLGAFFAACGALDGGNIQIHPPVGKQ
jgi:hypothetical protein